MAGDIDNIFAFGAQQQVEMYNRIASYKEKQAAHEMLASKVLHENSQLALRHTIQAMRPTMMLRPLVARSDDGVIEAMECADCDYGIFIQWHPESMYENLKHRNAIYGSLISACKRK